MDEKYQLVENVIRSHLSGEDSESASEYSRDAIRNDLEQYGVLKPGTVINVNADGADVRNTTLGDFSVET